MGHPLRRRKKRLRLRLQEKNSPYRLKQPQ